MKEIIIQTVDIGCRKETLRFGDDGWIIHKERRMPIDSREAVAWLEQLDLKGDLVEFLEEG